MRGDIALFLGLVALVGGSIVVAVIILSGGGGSSTCDSSLAPLGESEVSQLGFQTQEVGLTRVIQAATAGNLQAAEAAFFGDVHNFAHNVDPPIREVNEELARELCEAVIGFEDALVPPVDIGNVAAGATRIRELLRDAAEALGFARPGE